MDKVIQSKAVLLPNNIDTDQIYPGRFLALVEPEEIGRHCLEGIDESIRALVPGSILVAGTNFGCGSSREHAVITLMSAGVKAVIAESFARIFFRNAINLGLPLIVCKGARGKIRTGDVITVDVGGGTVTMGNGETLHSEKLGDHILSIIEAGGIKPLFLKGVS
jgi:3-isopropylmalate/(R)-2-methylmalate dehydratase small subunit